MILATSRPSVVIPAYHAMCPRYGLVRQVRAKNVRDVCGECKSTMTEADLELWAA